MRRVSINDVFSDGNTARDVRDAVLAAVLAEQWQFAVQLARTYKIHGSICMKCGLYFGDPTGRTYVLSPQQQSIAMCLGCAAAYRSRRPR